jgi:ubiquinone/menaquinone biosynthesis C-methylase UbiE
MQEQKVPSPELFFQTINAYQQTAALKAALDLKVFSAIGKEKRTPEEIAKKTGTSVRGMRTLCDYLTILGFLNKEDQRFLSTAESALFLDEASPAYIGKAIEFLLSPTLTSAFRDLAATVRKGGTILEEGGTVATPHRVWVDFARAMSPITAMSARLIADLVPENKSALKVLDVAASHGLFGIEFAKRNPKTEVYALDWAHVLEVAKENAQAAGVSDRYHLLPGSAFEVNLGEGYDVVLITNFLHHFDPPTNESFLRKVRSALKKSGKAITLEFVPDEDRIHPPPAGAFSMMMLATTERGDAYTFREFDSMFRNAGFSRSEIHEIQPSFEKVVVSYP